MERVFLAFFAIAVGVTGCSSRFEQDRYWLTQAPARECNWQTTEDGYQEWKCTPEF